MSKRYRLNDLTKEQFICFPKAFLASNQYRSMTLEAKMIYSLLLDRLSLSQRNNWTNTRGEVYLIFPRAEVERLLNVSHKKAVSAFRELVTNELIHEERRGLGMPNLIYVLKTELSEVDAEAFTRSFEQADQNDGQSPCETGSSDTEEPDSQKCKNDTSGGTDSTLLEVLPEPACQTDTSRSVKMTLLEVPNGNATKTYSSQTYGSDTYVLPSARGEPEERIEGHSTIQQILEQSELYADSPVSGEPLFTLEERRAGTSMLESLYYANTVTVRGSSYPQQIIHRHLEDIDGAVLRQAFDKLRDNVAASHSGPQYASAILFNELCEAELDPIRANSGQF